jgi:hypothetical protein
MNGVMPGFSAQWEMQNAVLAGSGVTMLELHWANFQALHVLVWHTAVVPVSTAAGALGTRALAGQRYQLC